MFGRRSNARLKIAPAARGVLKVLRDVVVQRADAAVIVLLSGEAGVIGELLTLEFADDVEMAAIPGRVADSRPVIVNGSLRHQVRLARLDDARASGREMSNEGTRPTVSRVEDAVGVLAREFPVHLLNCSASGCLIESRSPIPVSTAGTLRICWNGEEFTEDIRVVRCQQIEGAGSIYHVGAQFLWTRMPGRGSLRHACRQAGGSLVDERPDGRVL